VSGSRPSSSPPGALAQADTTDANGEVVVEPMRRRHLRAVVRIEGQRGEPGWSLGLFLAELGRPEGRTYLVARRAGRVEGYLGALHVGDDVHITTVAVAPDARRRGVASRLLLALARRAVEAGHENMTLEVRSSNVAARELYRRFGFVPVGTRRDYYTGPGDEREDALVLWATDIGGVAFAERLAILGSGLDARPHGAAPAAAPTDPEPHRPPRSDP
jgi:ribosomal-protein-alanine N-acetyltransferase